MRKIQLAIFSIVVFAGLVMLWRQHKAQGELRKENVELHQRIDQASQVDASDREGTKPIASLQTPAASTIEQMAELEKLRTEAAAQGKELENIRAQLAAAKNAPGTEELPASFRFEKLPKESWAFAGYATPEAALQSMLWATREGDVAALRNSLTDGELNRRRGGEWKGKNDGKIAAQGWQELTNVTRFQILKVEMLDPETTHFSVYVDGFGQPDQPLWMDVKKVGNEWKSDASERHRDH